MNDYAKEKLKFVSHLNGTHLSDLTMVFTTMPVINCLSFMLKMFIVFMVYKDSSQIKKKYSFL
jgi:hypothetical protein